MPAPRPAATLIGNPQNMLIGQTLGVSFGGYLLEALLPSVLGCIVLWGVIAWQFRRSWTCPATLLHAEARPLDRWQTIKGLVVIAGVVGAFLFTSWPRETVALCAAGVLMLSRRLHTREMLGLVDWQLLVLFGGLFVVNDAIASTSLMRTTLGGLAGGGVDLHEPGWLFAAVVVLSNLVSNVPAVMLLLPAAEHEQAALVLALGSTLAGNMFIVASIANIVVVDQAQRVGMKISWIEHARTGVPVTLLTLAVAAAWLVVLACL
jgi:Na+/H+ antiporter NhaD/arsenite permease-like protein